MSATVISQGSAIAPQWSLQARTVVVTGAAGGMGSNCVSRLLAAGASVVAQDRDEERLLTLAESWHGQVEPVVGDLTQTTTVQRLVGAASEMGGVDAVIHTAGIMETRPFLELTAESWRSLLDINLTASFTVVQVLGRALLDRGQGSIVLFSSVAGRSGRASAAHYAASKAGVLSLTKSAAIALGPKVRVNAVCPGVVLTRMWDGIISQRNEKWGPGSGQAYLDEVVEKSCLKRAGTLDEISDAAMFLISDASSYITGQALNVDGGLEMN